MSEPPENDVTPYQAMAEAVRASVEELLIPFSGTLSHDGIVRNMTSDEFFQRFLVYADKFTDKCCQDLSKIFRESSVLPELRGTPTLQLAKQVREVTFEQLDRILVSYVQALQKIHFDLREATTSLSQSSLIGEAMKGAAIGQVAGGLGDGGKLWGAVGALAAAGKEAAKQQALVEEQQRLATEAKTLAFSKVVEYLKAVDSMPENLLDYGCSKCFGGQIDFKQQGAAIAMVQGEIRGKLQASCQFIIELQQREKEAVAEAEKAAAAERAKKEEEEKQSTNKGCAVLYVIVGVMLMGVAIAALAGGTEWEIGLPGGLGLVLLATGIFTLTNKGKK